MDLNPEETYYKINRVLLQWLGIWPSGNPTLKRVQAMFSYVTIISSLFTQFASVWTAGVTIDNALSALSLAVPGFAALLKYTTFKCQAENIQSILNTIRNDWNELKQEKASLHILKKYADDTRLLTTIIAWNLGFAIFGFVFLHFLPLCLDLLIPLNESRPCSFAIKAEYFVDKQTYCFPIIFHMIFTFIIAATTVIATELELLVFVQHACCIFKITGYRFEHTFDCIDEKATNIERDRAIYDRIVRTAKIHSNGIRFTEFVWETFAVSYILLILLGVTSLSCNMYRFIRAVTMGAGAKQLCGYSMFFFAQFIHLFLCNFFAQRLIDHSTDIFDKTYNVPWYEVSIPTRKLLLFILQRTNKKTAFVAASVFTASLEGFSTLASTSFSYFTVMYSTL